MSKYCNGLLSRLETLWGKLIFALAILACVFVLIMVGVICLDVGARALRLGNFPWAPEISEYALYLSTFCSAPWLLREGKHIRMDLMLRSLPPRLAWYTELIADLIGASTVFVLGFVGLRTTIASAKQDSIVLKVFVIPEWWILAPASLLLLIVGVEFVFRIKRLVSGPREIRDEATSAA